MVKIPIITKITTNQNNDVFIKRPNGILEILFSRSIAFAPYPTTTYPANIYNRTGIAIPNEIPLKKGITIEAILDANGVDANLLGINNIAFKNIKPPEIFVVPSIYIAAGKYDNDFEKTVHFHVFGMWD